MNTKIITPGEKIKNLRKLYKIKQHEITGDKITRNMISMIETDKAGLTEYTANILIENITRVCADKGICINLSLEYLMESGETQAVKIAKEFMERLDADDSFVLKKEFDEYINDVEGMIEKYKLKKEKFYIYTRLGLVHKKNFDYIEHIPTI